MFFQGTGLNNHPLWLDESALINPRTFTSYNKPMRKIITIIALTLGVVFIFSQFTEIGGIFQTVRQGRWQFIILALFVEFFWLLTVGAAYKLIYRALNMWGNFAHLTLLAAAAYFIDIVAPSMGVGGVSIFVTEAKRRNLSMGKATAAGAVFVTLDYIGLLSIISLGLIVLFRRNSLSSTEIIPSAVIATLAIVAITVLYLGTISAERLARFLCYFVRGINRILYPIIKRPFLQEENARRYAHELSSGLTELKGNPRRLLPPLMLTVFSKLLLISILALCFMAFNTPISIGTLVASFSIAYMFLIVSPTPSGVGFVEGALTLALTSMYVPLRDAVVISLVYRGITFWVPMFFGMLAFQRISGSKPVSEPSQSD